MIKRQLVVIASLLFLLAACGGAPTPTRTDITVPAQFPTEDPLDALQIDPNGLVVIMGTQFSYTAPNPNGDWSTVGPRINPIDDFTTQITLERYPNFVGDDADLEALLPEFTAADFELKETENGNLYAEGVDVVDTPFIFMIKSGYLMQFNYNEGVTPPASAYEDFVTITTQGRLVELK